MAPFGLAGHFPRERGKKPMSSSQPTEPSAGYFRGRVHILPVRIYYEDTDFSGMVYHANYLRYFERGRSDVLRLAGIGHTAIAARAEPLAFTVRRIEIEFFAPARIDDALEVRSAYEEIAGARIQVRQEIYRAAERLTAAKLEVICMTLAGRPRRIPPDLLAAFAPFLAGASPQIGRPPKCDGARD
jgi:acyl-CoA thioester hydrolase